MCYLGPTEPDCGYPILWFLMVQRSQEDRNTERSTLVTNSRVMTSLPVSESCKHGHLATQHFPRHSSYSITNTNNNNNVFFQNSWILNVFTSKITHRSKTTAYRKDQNPQLYRRHVRSTLFRPVWGLKHPLASQGAFPWEQEMLLEIHQRQILN